MNSSILSSLSPTSYTGFNTLANVLNHLGGAKNPNCNGQQDVANVATPNAAATFITQQTTTITEKGYSLTVCLVLFFMMVAFAIIGVISTISWGAYQAEIDASSDDGSGSDDDDSGRYTSGVLAAIFTTLTIIVAFVLIFYLYINARSCKGKEFVAP
jgi:hypothetical protein